MSDLITQEQGAVLLTLARSELKARLFGGEGIQCPEDPALQSSAATFVTLKKTGKLRGCIGNLHPVGPVWKGVCDNAINAAFHDGRFPELQPAELKQVCLSISILSPSRPLSYSDPETLPLLLRPGIDGVILGDGRRRATFLPQVWQQLPDPEQFLDNLCMKAGLPRGEWREKKLDVETYQVQCFSEEE